MTSPLHQPALHESGLRHATGEALYVDDLPPPRGMLHGWTFVSNVAHGRVLRLDVEAARAMPGVHAVLTAEDIPGHNDIAPVGKDEPLLATDRVYCVGQHVALVVAESPRAARLAAQAIVAEYEELPPILDVRQAIAAGAFLTAPHVIQRGDVAAALASAHLVLEGEVETPAQDHFYLETHAALVVPEEDGNFRVWSSTQHPSEVQAKVAEILGRQRHQVVVETVRMGGGFGGKETQGAHFAALAALGAWKTRRPVKVWLNRDQDMIQTGKRHPFHSKYRVGFDRDGRILALEVVVHSDGGWSLDLSRAILDRCLFHLDNAYYLPNVHFVGRVCRTHQPSNTAFRGFGGPQGVAVIEVILERAALALGLDSAEIRARNFYGPAPLHLTPYGQEVKDCRLERLHRELLVSSSYAERLAEVVAFNQHSVHHKRGLAFQPVKFGISFTHSMLNQAGALVLIYADGTVQVNHGGTEMGQGLHTKMLAVAAHELGLPVSRVRVMPTATDKVPNTSATAASSGADLNGAAVQAACATLRGRLEPLARELLAASPEAPVEWAEGAVRIGGRTLPFVELVGTAYARQISLSATGYYRTPDIHYDPQAGRGKPFHYYAYGAAVVEVEVSGLTGEHKLRRVDILHDVGDSLVPTIDRGQIEGAFVQGLGWLTTEQLVVDGRGRLLTHSPDTYKIPSAGDVPRDFRVALLHGAPQADVIHGSKAVGEPPLMLALGVVSALRRAVAAFHPGKEVTLAIPCTPESVLRAIVHQKAHESSAEPRS